MTRRVAARGESWALSRPFRIARGVKTAADVIVAEIAEGGLTGRGEAVPYPRYGESVQSALAQIASAADAVAAGADRAALTGLLPPGAARNALDLALWDLESRIAGRGVAALIGAPPPGPMDCAVTISLAAPEEMARAAAESASAPLLKVKVSGDAPERAVAAARRAAPRARLIVDPNESWTPDQLVRLLPAMAALDVALIEQPVHADDDAALEGLAPPVPLCADESAHTSADLDRIARRYQAVNVKLDKAGGLTEALAMRDAARARGLMLMVGCMVCTSLGIAPALHLARGAEFVDLDGPWWLAEDRNDAMRYRNGVLIPPEGGWGAGI